MLKKKYRLPKFLKKERSKIINAGAFTLKLSANDRTYSRFGFIVSKAFDKRAVARNRIKRQLRAFIEKNLDKVAGGWDLLLRMKGSKEKDPRRLLAIFEDTLKKEKILK